MNQIAMVDKIELAKIDSLNPSDRNARKHPADQVNQIAASITKFGFNVPILVDESGGIIAGHGRHLAAIKLGMDRVPVIRAAHLTAEQVRAFMLADNRLAENSKWDKTLLAQELDAVMKAGFDLPEFGFDDKFVSRLFPDYDLDAPEESLEQPGVTDENFEGVKELNPYVTLPSTNEWGIPDLRADMLADTIPTTTWSGVEPIVKSEDTFVLFGSKNFSPKHYDTIKGTVIGFYVDDWRFERVWDDAVLVVNDVFKVVKPAALVMPDFSQWRDDPRAVQLWAQYRSRWCARFWQECGYKIIPSLNWSDPKTWSWIESGVPRNAPVVSFQCRSGCKGGNAEEATLMRTLFAKGVKHILDELKPQAVMIYGGVLQRYWIEPLMPKELHVVYLKSWTDMHMEHRAKKRDTTKIQ